MEESCTTTKRQKRSKEGRNGRIGSKPNSTTEPKEESDYRKNLKIPSTVLTTYSKPTSSEESSLPYDTFIKDGTMYIKPNQKARVIYLPLDKAPVWYIENFIPADKTKKLYTTFLQTLKWKKKDFENRATALYGDSGVQYQYGPKYGDYSKEDQTAIEWTEELRQIKTMIEEELKTQQKEEEKKKFNVCLGNYYANGKRGIGWHSDNEEIGAKTPIASISLGAAREFKFMQKKTSKQEDSIKKWSITLNDGSLIVMGQPCQEHYLHTIERDDSTLGRVNLTYRFVQHTS